MTASPRDLDPKFRTVEAPDDATAETETETTQPENAKDTSPEVPMIVHRQRFTDNEGVQREKEHRVPVADWAEYEKEHKL